MARVSVLIPSFRAEHTLARAVRSVLDQTLDDCEVVVASDDGMDYGRVLAGQGIDDARVRHVSTGRIGGGEGPARNAALSAATGAVVANLDADDAFAPDRLAELVPLAERHGAATDNTGVHDAQGGLIKVPFPDAACRFEMTVDRILGPRVPFFPVFRREHAGAGWTAAPFAADVLFNLELACRAESYVASPRPLYRYIKTPGSITQSPDTADVAERGYDIILDLLAGDSLDLTAAARTAAIQEFTDNRALNRLFGRYLSEGRVSSLDAFLDMTDRGRAPWVRREIETLGLQGR